MLSYFSNGKLKTECFFKTGKRHGVCKEFDIEGRILILDFCFEGTKVYTEKIKYKEGSTSNLRAFNPIVNVNQKNLQLKERLIVDFYLPLPDSLMKGDNLVYRCGFKSVEIKDTLILTGFQEFEVENNRKLTFEVKPLKNENKQFFFGYLIDTTRRIIYNDIETPVYINR